MLLAFLLSNIYSGLLEGVASASGTPPLLLPFIRSKGVLQQGFLLPSGPASGCLPSVAAAAAEPHNVVQPALPGSGGVEALNRHSLFV